MNETTVPQRKAEILPMPQSQHHIWVDGSSIGNPGPSAWAVLIDGHLHSGYIGTHTNNEAEMTAVYEGITRMNIGDRIIIHTDSKLIVGWFCHGWKLNSPTIRSLKETIDRIVYTCELTVSFVLTKGHSVDQNNNLVDRVAQSTARAQRTLPDRTSPH